MAKNGKVSKIGSKLTIENLKICLYSHLFRGLLNFLKTTERLEIIYKKGSPLSPKQLIYFLIRQTMLMPNLVNQGQGYCMVKMWMMLSQFSTILLKVPRNLKIGISSASHSIPYSLIFLILGAVNFSSQIMK